MATGPPEICISPQTDPNSLLPFFVGMGGVLEQRSARDLPKRPALDLVVLKHVGDGRQLGRFGRAIGAADELVGAAYQLSVHGTASATRSPWGTFCQAPWCQESPSSCNVFTAEMR